MTDKARATCASFSPPRLTNGAPRFSSTATSAARTSAARSATPDQRAKTHVLAQEIAISCDRFIESRGGTGYGFVTEPVARWQYGTEAGARRLADELFGRPDTVLTHLGLHPFGGEGTMFFAYEGSETVWEAANKGISYVPVRDIAEYGRILHAIRKGES